MRFMMLMIPKGYESAKPGTMPDPKHVAAMMKFNEELQKAGVLLALDGLHPPSTGARVSFAGGKPKVTDGPFAEAKEVLGGYWMLQVKSKEEAIEWAKRCPGLDNEMIEVRQVQEYADFPADIQEVGRRLAGESPRTEGEMTMRFIIMHKANAKDEAGDAADPGADRGSGRDGRRDEQGRPCCARATGCGPAPRACGSPSQRGKRTVTPGPFKGGNELPSAFCVVKVKSLDEAIEWATRLAAIAGDGEFDIRP